MPIEQRGLVVADTSILDALPKAAFKVTSWDNTHSRVAQLQLTNLCLVNNWSSERVFDAAHGRRYLVLIFRHHGERAACHLFLTRPGQ